MKHERASPCGRQNFILLALPTEVQTNVVQYYLDADHSFSCMKGKTILPLWTEDTIAEL